MVEGRIVEGALVEERRIGIDFRVVVDLVYAVYARSRRVYNWLWSHIGWHVEVWTEISRSSITREAIVWGIAANKCIGVSSGTNVVAWTNHLIYVELFVWVEVWIEALIRIVTLITTETSLIWVVPLIRIEALIWVETLIGIIALIWSVPLIASLVSSIGVSSRSIGAILPLHFLIELSG